jgi:hypothetical protein
MEAMKTTRTLRIVVVALAVALAAACGAGAQEPADAPAAPLADGDTWQREGRQIDRSHAWKRSGEDVLSGFGNMYHAKVLQVNDEDYPFRMWFFGWAAEDCNPGYPGCDAIFHARGRNLDDWEVYAGEGTWDKDGLDPASWVPVLAAQDLPYDAWHNGDPAVVLQDGVYYMAYSATGFNKDGLHFGREGDEDGYLYCVMGAISEDGIHWERSAKPLVIYEPAIGAERGPNDSFIYGMYHRPALLFDQGKWRLWFDYWTGEDVAMGYAEAALNEFMRGDFEVKYAGATPLLREWPNPAVVKHGDTYYGFADPSGYGQGWPGRQMAEATSQDGLRWRILGWIPPDPDTPACHVPTPTVIEDEKGVWLVVFYACQLGGEPDYDYRYNRIRYMKRLLEPKSGGNGSEAGAYE